MDPVTHSRITTTLALKDTARMMDSKDPLGFLYANLPRRLTRKNSAKMINDWFDNQYKGALIAKTILKDSKQRTSKNMVHTWLHLHYDPSRPFTRREEHLIPVCYTEMTTKRPEKFITISLNTYITRHFLERSALRFKATTIEDMIHFLHPHIRLATVPEYKDRSEREGGLIFVTVNEYVVIESIDTGKVIIKTVLPRNEWTNAQSNRLSILVDELENCDTAVEACKSIAVVSSKIFHSSDLIEPDQAEIINFNDIPYDCGYHNNKTESNTTPIQPPSYQAKNFLSNIEKRKRNGERR